MKLLIPATLLGAAVLSLSTSCAHHVQRAPALSNPPLESQPVASADAAPAPEHKSFLSRTADATWNVVSAPVKLLTPAKKPAPPPPPTYEAPQAIIVVPEAAGGEGLLGVATQPAIPQSR